MSDTKPTAGAMRAAEAVICDEGRRRDIPAVATIIDKAAGLPALERCRDLLNRAVALVTWIRAIDCSGPCFDLGETMNQEAAQTVAEAILAITEAGEGKVEVTK